MVTFFLNIKAMDNVDVQIYLSQIKTFFKENPNELLNLIGSAKPEDFYKGVEKIAEMNFNKGEDVQLTQKQMVNLIVKLNGGGNKKYYVKGKFANMFLN